MKNRNFWSFITNPFIRIAGWQAFGVGLIFTAVTAVIGTLSNTAMDGVLDTHYTLGLTYGQSFIMMGINIVSITLVMSLAALFVSKSFRIADILGTMTLARAPYLIMALTGFFVNPEDLASLMEKISVMEIPYSLIILSIVAIPVMAWSVTLMYNGMKVSCNIKGAKLAITFTLGIIIAEVLSKFLIYLVLL